MQAQQAILTFSEAEKPLGDRLLKIAVETDRVEGYSEPHAIAIARMAEKIGAMVGLHGIDLTALKFAALAHDLGERAMKRNYLLRPGQLRWEETLDLWRHPILGEQAAGELKLSRQAQLLIRWHHEWWNGQGYPDGLAGEAIPVGARILRAVDSYFALASDRPHRQRFDRLEAEQVIADLAGIEFDPWIAKLLLAILVEERRSWPDTSEPETWAAPVEPEIVVAFVEPESYAASAEAARHSIEDQPAPGALPDEPQIETVGDYVIQETVTETAESLIYYDEPVEPRGAFEIEPTPVDAEQPLKAPAPEAEPAEESAPAAHDGVSESTGDSAEAPRQKLNENDTDEDSEEPKPKVEN
jgi:hypothetical protein